MNFNLVKLQTYVALNLLGHFKNLLSVSNIATVGVSVSSQSFNFFGSLFALDSVHVPEHQFGAQTVELQRQLLSDSLTRTGNLRHNKSIILGLIK